MSPQQPPKNTVEEYLDNEWPTAGDQHTIISTIITGLIEKGLVTQNGPGWGPYTSLFNLFWEIWPAPNSADGGETDWADRPGRSEIVPKLAEALLTSDRLYVSARPLALSPGGITADDLTPPF